MALTERTEIDLMQVLADGQIQVREATVIERDGVEISRTYHRHVVAPGDDLDAQDARVKQVGQAVHTADVKTAFAAKKAAAQSALE